MSYIDTKKKWNRIVACVMAVILSASMTISAACCRGSTEHPKRRSSVCQLEYRWFRKGNQRRKYF